MSKISKALGASKVVHLPVCKRCARGETLLMFAYSHFVMARTLERIGEKFKGHGGGTCSSSCPTCWLKIQVELGLENEKKP